MIAHRSSLSSDTAERPEGLAGLRLDARSYAEQMAGVAVVTDSTSSLGPSSRRPRAEIAVIPLQVVIDGLSRPESDVPAAEVADALRAGRRVSTSRPTPEVIGSTYADLAAAGYEAIVSVHLSAKISGTCGAAEVAAAAAPVPVIVVDSGTLAMGAGFAVLPERGGARSGAGAEAVAERVRRRRPRLRPPTSTSTAWSTCAEAGGSARRPPCSARHCR